MAEDTEYFVWIPNSEPRRYGAVFAAWGAALIGIVCVCAIGNVPPRGVVDIGGNLHAAAHTLGLGSWELGIGSWEFG